MRDETLKALLHEHWTRAGRGTAVTTARDGTARAAEAAALHASGDWPAATRAFSDVLLAEGPAGDLAPAALCGLASCRLHLGDPRGALEASTLAVELTTDDHPCYRDALRTAASAAATLGHRDLALRIRRVLAHRPRGSSIVPIACWPRVRILRAAFRAMGWRRTPLPASVRAWLRNG